MAGIMLGRPFRGEIEDDLAWRGAVADEPVATMGGFEPVATTGVDVFAPAAEA